MKVRKFLAMMVVALLSVGFVSCSDDDENGDFNPGTIDLSGEYLGARAVLMKGVQNFDTTHVAKVELQANGKYSLTLPKSVRKDKAPAAKKMTMPLVVLKDLTFVEENGFHTLILGNQMLTFPEMQIELKSLEAKIDAKKKTLDIHYVMQPVGMPFALDYTFKTVTATEFISGSFEGVASLEVKGKPQGDPKTVAKIFVQSEGKIAIALPVSIKEETPTARGMEMPAAVVTDLEVKKDANGAYTFGFANKEVAAGKMNIVINNFEGKVVDNVLTLSYSFKPGAMPLFIDTKFNGEK